MGRGREAVVASPEQEILMFDAVVAQSAIIALASDLGTSHGHYNGRNDVRGIDSHEEILEALARLADVDVDDLEVSNDDHSLTDAYADAYEAAWHAARASHDRYGRSLAERGYPGADRHLRNELASRDAA